MKWKRVSKGELPKASDPMNTYQVVVWFRDRPAMGWYIGGHLKEWRVEGSPNAQDIEYWFAVEPPIRRGNKKGD